MFSDGMIYKKIKKKEGEKMKKRSVKQLLALLLAMILVLGTVGCGNSDEETKGSTEGPKETQSGDTSTTEAPATTEAEPEEVITL